MLEKSMLEYVLTDGHKHHLDPVEDLRNSVSKRSYPSRKEKKHLIDLEVERTIEFVRSSRGDDALNTGGLTGTVLSRRIASTLSAMEHLPDELPEKTVSDLISLEETVAQMEFIPSMTYDVLDYNEGTLTAAAIWILDDLRKSGKIHDSHQFMPTDYDHVLGMDLPLNFSHPCYENELIQSVMAVIANRDCMDGEYLKFLEVFTNNRAAEMKKPASKQRRDFDGLMALINPDAAKKAGETVKAKIKEVLERYLNAVSVCNRLDTQAVAQLTSSSSILSVNPREDAMIVKDVFLTTEENLNMRTILLRDFAYLLAMPLETLTAELGSKRVARHVAGFTIDDPYEMCFGLIYLLEQGDDTPWLFKPGCWAMHVAASLLPWHDNAFITDEEEDWDDPDTWVDTDLHFNQNDWLEKDFPESIDILHESFEDRNLAQMVYDLSGAVLPRNMHPFAEKRQELLDAGMDERLVSKVIDSAELLFLTEFEAGARNLHSGEWWEETDETAEDTDEISQDRSSSESSIDETLEQIKRLKAENKNLRKALSELSRSSAKEKAGYEKKISSLMQEHRELADLRELIFNRENVVDDIEGEEISTPIHYPYETSKRTVVFGGHESFLKSFKQKFTNVRFVDADQYAFSADIIRNADIVWIQNNRISHAQYYAIINTARKHGIQVRYFPYASAEKCARILINEDRQA